MTDAAIRVHDLGKRYRLGHVQARHQALRRHRTLREAMTDGIGALARGLLTVGRTGRTGATDHFIWALKDVSLDIQPGEVVGIIGGNGAGKSTFLKILSRVTKPTTGWVSLHGRVGSLLEVGTGFHAELTGRENIYLSGAILGMRHAEIQRKFDAIVEFAGVARFIDTPVKRYSSGMYLRLAFAVAAHLEPEVLLVDEVLAVGDAEFQKKCLGKMDDVAKTGRTVLFVSHNMDAVRRLCPRSVMLAQGSVAGDGDSADIIARYLSQRGSTPQPGESIDLSDVPRRGSGEARFVAVRFSNVDGVLGGHAYPEGALEFALEIESDVARSVESMSVSIKTQTGTRLINADIVSQGERLHLGVGRTHVRLRIVALHLNPGIYVVGLWLGHLHSRGYDHVDSAFELEVVEGGHQGFGMTPRSGGAVSCNFLLFQHTSTPSGLDGPTVREEG